MLRLNPAKISEQVKMGRQHSLCSACCAPALQHEESQPIPSTAHLTS